MKHFFKYSLIIYFSIAYFAIYSFADFSILKSNPENYTFVPQDADQIIEINTKTFIKKVTFQFFYNDDYVSPYLTVGNSSEIDIFKKMEIRKNGIDISSKIILFSELWKGETLWYCILGVTNEQDFTLFAKQKTEIVKFELVNDFAICLLTNPEQLESVTAHLKQISNKKVKSINSKIELSKKFNSENEINYYISSEGSKYITDGLGSITFNNKNICFEGVYTTIGALKYLENTSKEVNLHSALSLKTTFNFSDELSEYNELSVDYFETKIVTSNSSVPMHVYPLLNMFVSGDKTNNWNSLIEKIDKQDNLVVDLNRYKIQYVNQLALSIGYKMIGNDFVLTNNPLFVGLKNEHLNSNKLLELTINPDVFFQNINFIEDEINPPSMMSNLKIGVFNNVLNEISSINKVDKMYCSVNYSDDKTKFLLNGEITFKEKSGHSIIESGTMLIELLNSIEIVTDFK